MKPKCSEYHKSPTSCCLNRIYLWGSLCISDSIHCEVVSVFVMAPSATQITLCVSHPLLFLSLEHEGKNLYIKIYYSYGVFFSFQVIFLLYLNNQQRNELSCSQGTHSHQLLAFWATQELLSHWIPWTGHWQGENTRLLSLEKAASGACFGAFPPSPWGLEWQKGQQTLVA